MGSLYCHDHLHEGEVILFEYDYLTSHDLIGSDKAVTGTFVIPAIDEKEILGNEYFLEIRHFCGYDYDKFRVCHKKSTMTIDYVEDYGYIYYDKINLENMKFEETCDKSFRPWDVRKKLDNIKWANPFKTDIYNITIGEGVM
ncbi:hypothetical protein WR25_11269 [Diploscapter pachys]|uniref:Uncharacterized protein n=1 Tax=Diploscapter pachys TaxID=2018661 RepID=A0A2A2KAX8_9BILA|nr:hypothetical protein WR25_11269 [Diploscapter pachys]